VIALAAFVALAGCGGSGDAFCTSPCEEVARFDGHIIGIAADATHVVVETSTDKQTRIAALPAHGGASTTLGIFGQPNDIGTIALAGDFVYLWQDDTISRVRVGGGKVEPLVQPFPLATDLAVGPGVVVAVNLTRLIAISLAGAHVVDLDAPPMLSSAVILGVDAKDVYWHQNLDGPITLVASPLDGSPSRVVAHEDLAIVGAIDAGQAYLGAGPNGIATRIVKIPLAGGPTTTLVTGKFPRNATGFSRLVVDRGFVYVSDDRGVSAVSKNGGTSQPFAPFGATFLGTGKDDVYLAPSSDDQELVRVPKLAP
jgi:hypothetical protein